jgi:hypothetical protein
MSVHEFAYNRIRGPQLSSLISVASSREDALERLPSEVI